MDILFKREQGTSTWFGKVIFKLHSKVEFNEEEQALVTNYKFDQSMLIDVPQPRLLLTSAILGLAVFAAVFVFFLFGLQRYLQIYVAVNGLLNILVSLGSALVVAVFYYHQKRETIYVRDLIVGRYFKCKSVVELARKEAYLVQICGYLRQVIESAKHWDGTEKHEVLPLPPEEAKRMILSGPMI